MAQQTAVKWLKDTLESFRNKHELLKSWGTLDELIEQAKAMEKKQLEERALEYFKAGQDSMEEGGKSFDQWVKFQLKMHKKKSKKNIVKQFK